MNKTIIINKIPLVFLAIISFLIMEGCCHTAKNYSSVPKNDPLRTINLFNGENLDGWYSFIQHRGRDNDPKNVFSVHDGLLHISGEELGTITTKKAYQNYKLDVEFKWGTKTYGSREGKAMDNGVLIHSTGADGASGGIWMYSIEINVIEGGTGDFIVIGGGQKGNHSLTTLVAPKIPGSSYYFKEGGDSLTVHGGRINWFGRDPNWKDVTGFRGKNDIEKPSGEWNHLEIIADGNKISVTLNGTLVNRAFSARPNIGRIQIQSEGAEIFYRKVDIARIR